MSRLGLDLVGDLFCPSLLLLERTEISPCHRFLRAPGPPSRSLSRERRPRPATPHRNHGGYGSFDVSGLVLLLVFTLNGATLVNGIQTTSPLSDYIHQVTHRCLYHRHKMITTTRRQVGRLLVSEDRCPEHDEFSIRCSRSGRCYRTRTGGKNRSHLSALVQDLSATTAT